MTLHYCHCITAIALLPLLYCYCITAIALLPLNYCHCITAIAFSPLHYCHCIAPIALVLLMFKASLSLFFNLNLTSNVFLTVTGLPKVLASSELVNTFKFDGFLSCWNFCIIRCNSGLILVILVELFSFIYLWHLDVLPIPHTAHFIILNSPPLTNFVSKKYLSGTLVLSILVLNCACTSLGRHASKSMRSVSFSACTDCGPRPPLPPLRLIGRVGRGVDCGCIGGLVGGGLTGCSCCGGCVWGCDNVITSTCPFNPEPEGSTLWRVVPLNTTGVLRYLSSPQVGCSDQPELLR